MGRYGGYYGYPYHRGYYGHYLARGPLMPNPRLMPLLMLGTDITDTDTDTVDITAMDTTVTPDTDTVMAVTTVRKLATKHCYFLPTLLIDQPPFFKIELPSQLSTDLHPVFIKEKNILDEFLFLHNDLSNHKKSILSVLFRL